MLPCYLSIILMIVISRWLDARHCGINVGDLSLTDFKLTYTMMNDKKNPLAVFEQEAPEVAKAFNQLVEALKDTTGLDAKTKQLIYIGIKAAMGDVTAIFYHVAMAKQLGATRDEIKDTILITLTVNGLSGVAACLPVALDVYDKTEKH